MTDSGFFRLRLDGSTAPIPYLELHFVRRDILLYFDENVGEPINVLMPLNVFKQDYWKFLSINFDQEWAESVRYKRLIERGCLALINGITLEILYEPMTNLEKTWSERKITVTEIIPYVENYVPSCPVLAEGKRSLLETLLFIKRTSPEDIDTNGDITNFDIVPTAKWFDENIVQEYFVSMAKEWTR